MSILFLWIWQTFESEDNKSSMNLMDERLAIIEEQITIVDETNNDTITDISSSIQFLDKEIRKLWDLSNKRNKVNIQKLSEQTIKIEQLLKSLEDEVSNNQSTITNMRDSIDQNISNIQELGISADDLSIIRLNLSSIDTQLMLLDDTVQALNSYKNQLNQTILEIQTQINTTQSQKMSDEEEN
jgi:prefoldin subunit 5